MREAGKPVLHRGSGSLLYGEYICFTKDMRVRSVLPGNLEMGKVHASTYFSHGPSRSSGPPGSSEPPEPSGSPEPSGHPDPDSLQLELVLPQRYSTGAYGSIEATNFKVLLKNTWPFLVVEVGKERRKVFSW